MAINYKQFFEDVDAVPPAHHQSAIKTAGNSYIKFMKDIENAGRTGFKNGKWYPHKSPEGGMPTIGYGHKIKSKSELQKMN